MKMKTTGGIFLAAVMCALALGLRAELRTVQPDDDQVARWNRFVDDLYALHVRQLEGRAVRIAERIGSYHRFPDFYDETAYIDEKTNAPLSIVQRERAHPERLHFIQVFVYDDRGRLTRDYSATYLPWGRNAPIQTLVNLHHHASNLHAYRSFDASDRHLYDACKGRYEGRTVDIDLDEFAMIEAEKTPNGVLQSKAYHACFATLPASAGRYLMPH